MTLTPIPTTTTSTAADALVELGVAAPVVVELTDQNPSDLILTWCEYASTQSRMGPGALIIGIRSGEQPPTAAVRRVSSTSNVIAESERYGRQIVAWLTEHMPDVCKPDPKVIAWERKLYGDQAALQLEQCCAPHPAATAAVIRLHHIEGKGRLTVRQHGPAIRGAVRVANTQAIADSKAIAAEREQLEASKPSTRRSNAR